MVIVRSFLQSLALALFLRVGARTDSLGGGTFSESPSVDQLSGNSIGQHFDITFEGATR